MIPILATNAQGLHLFALLQHYFLAPNLVADFGLPISMATSVEDDEELGSRRTDSNMAAVSALARI